MWIDAHNHLQDPALEPHLPEILASLDQIGPHQAVVNGTEESDWPRVRALAAAHPWIIPSYGLHPWFSKNRTPSWLETLESFVATAPCGLGECGLDRWIEGHDLADQTIVLRQQLDLAARYQRPVSLHCIQAWGALSDVLHAVALPECGFLIHSYGGPAEMTAPFARLGAYFSFSGWFLHERQADRRALFRHLPLDRILVETDAPSLPLPVEKQTHSLDEGINHPANIAAVYRTLAEIRQMPLDELTAQIAANFARLFQR